MNNYTSTLRKAKFMLSAVQDHITSEAVGVDALASNMQEQLITMVNTDCIKLISAELLHSQLAEVRKRIALLHELVDTNNL